MANTVSWKLRNDTWPLTTTYTSFNANTIRNAIRQELMDKDVDVMSVNWQKQTITSG